MNITGSEKFEKFCKKHNDAQTALEKWVEEVTKASWKNHNELKNDYLSADYVGNNRYVFNVNTSFLTLSTKSSYLSDFMKRKKLKWLLSVTTEHAIYIYIFVL